jgi:hypothetical protein
MLEYGPNHYAAYKRESATSTREALIALLDSGALQGTLARHKYNEAVYWCLNSQWHYGIPDDISAWLYLGSLGWYPDEDGKILFHRVRDMAGNMWPQYPGEYSVFGPQLTLDI